MGTSTTKEPPVHTLDFEVLSTGPYPDRKKCIWSLPIRKDPDLIIIALIEFHSGKPALYVHVAIDKRVELQVILDALDSILRNSPLNLRFVKKELLFCRSLRVLEKDDPKLNEPRESENLERSVLIQNPSNASDETLYAYDDDSLYGASEAYMEKNQIYALYVKQAFSFFS